MNKHKSESEIITFTYLKFYKTFYFEKLFNIPNFPFTKLKIIKNNKKQIQSYFSFCFNNSWSNLIFMKKLKIEKLL